MGEIPKWLQGEGAELALSLLGLFAASVVVYFVARLFVVRGLRALIRRSETTWDDALVDSRLFVRLAYIAPALVVYYGIKAIPHVPDFGDDLIRRVTIAVMVVVTAATFSALLSAVNRIWSSNPANAHRPIKGYLQVLQIVVFGLAAVIVVSTLVDRSPWIFVSGIGAMTAVLMLVFKDTILSLVASVQIASNDMVRVGDWIEMPQSGADGDVVDIALHTVKVQNWDKTISTIPTYKFISDSFKNWRGMSESGGRRIKRSIYIDVNSIRFLRHEEIERFREWALLRDYIDAKQGEIEAFNHQPGRNAEIAADIRQLTNVGTLRAYLDAYLKAHPKVHTEGYTLIVRQLQPGPQGLPIEIYCFSNDQDWGRYEAVQADIFDHVLAMVGEFGLRVYQQPGGADLERLAEGGTPASTLSQAGASNGEETGRHE